MTNEAVTRPTIAALTPDQLEALRKIDTPTISNAIEAFKVRDRSQGFMGMNIRCLFPDLGVMVGYAVTATADSTTPGSPRGREGLYRMWEALAAAPKPAVLVIKDLSPRPRHSCHFGEVMGNTAKRLGAVGVVTDGGVRDINEVRALGLHYFAAGLVPSHGNFGILDVGIPVEVDGVLVRPGDLLHGDANGVLVIPAEVTDRLIDEVERVRQREAAMIQFINGPDFSLEGLKKMLGL